MVQVQERTTNKPSAHLKAILLVANDDATMSPLVDVLSQELHYHIYVASSSFAAVKFVRHITPHLLMIDNCLPDMPGIQLYDYLHANRGLAALPAIILSANLEELENEVAARKLIGFSKPFDLDELLTTIETLFALEGAYIQEPI
jgi:DNA-binding response OmpR family regulator